MINCSLTGPFVFIFLSIVRVVQKCFFSNEYDYYIFGEETLGLLERELQTKITVDLDIDSLCGSSGSR